MVALSIVLVSEREAHLLLLFDLVMRNDGIDNSDQQHRAGQISKQRNLRNKAYSVTQRHRLSFADQYDRQSNQKTTLLRRKSYEEKEEVAE